MLNLLPAPLLLLFLARLLCRFALGFSLPFATMSSHVTPPSRLCKVDTLPADIAEATSGCMLNTPSETWTFHMHNCHTGHTHAAFGCCWQSIGMFAAMLKDHVQDASQQVLCCAS